MGTLTEGRPTAWQERDGVLVPVGVGYDVRERVDGRPEEREYEVGFDIGSYDRELPLVIDPPLIYATYLGGSGDDYANGVAVDGDGNAYVVGFTSSTEGTFPNGNGFGTIPGFDKTFNGGGDAFVVKISGAGSSLTYATYLGGNNPDQATAVAVDSSGNAYVAGVTSSTEVTFPGGSGFGAIPGFRPDQQ